MQLVQLQESLDRWQKLGYNVASASYDILPTIREFSETQKIQYPMLSDPDSKLLKAFNLIDPDNTDNNRPDYAKENMAYAATMVIDANGVVLSRFVEDIYHDRYTPLNMLAKLHPETITWLPLADSNPPVDIAMSDPWIFIGSRSSLYFRVPSIKDSVKNVAIEVDPETVKAFSLRPIEWEQTREGLVLRQDVLSVPDLFQKQPQLVKELRASSDRSAVFSIKATVKVLLNSPGERVVSSPVIWTLKLHLPKMAPRAKPENQWKPPL